MSVEIRLLSTDFDGTLVAHHLNSTGGRTSLLDPGCMALIQELQKGGAIWAVNTGRSLELLESGLTDFDFPVRPDFILTSERDVFRPCANGVKWEAYGDWNAQVARDHAELYATASPVLTEVVRYVNEQTKARVLYDGQHPEGLIAQDEAELAQIIEFIDGARAEHPKFHYQHNTVYLRFCHADYHKGAALAELQRLLEITREQTFAAGDHHNDISMLDGRYAQYPACPGNSIEAVKETVRKAGGYVAQQDAGAGVREALQYFMGEG